MSAPRATPYLGRINVVYGDDAGEEPSDSIEVIDNKSGDINQGFHGKYVWLVPLYDRFPIYTGISIVIQSGKEIFAHDLGKDAGGYYRYLKFENQGSHRIGRVALLRSDRAIDFRWVDRLGWNGFTSDINEGRHGSYLYIVWKWA